MIAETIIGIYARPSQRMNTFIMAFGIGALIQELAIELAFKGAQRLTTLLHYSGLEAWVWLQSGSALAKLDIIMEINRLMKKVQQCAILLWQNSIY
jgi:hypothetical protein